MWAAIGVLGWFGCTGNDGDHDSVPFFDDGIVSEGDCDAQIVETDAFAVTQLYRTPANDPALNFDVLGDDVGTIVRDNTEYANLMTALGFASWLVVDFDKNQVGATWYEAEASCGFAIDDVGLKSKADGDVVFEAQFFDASINCESTCDTPVKGLVMWSFPNDMRASYCRRVRPGCPPN
ncbi:MAG: hypothetical protein ABMB14_01810 [Myxococcota bacterium]